MIQIPVGPYGSGDALLNNTRPAIIDGDSIPWIVGWTYKDSDDVGAVIDKVDDFIHSILQAVQSRLYIGVLSGKNPPGEELVNFRAAIAKTKVYKGNRGDKPEWYEKWAPIIENHLIEEWKFIRCSRAVESDDLVASLMYRLNSFKGCNPICCGNDKDLLQVPGHHYNYVKNVISEIDSSVAFYNLCRQILTGDTTDNIPGLHKCGPVGAEAILNDPELDAQNVHVGVFYAFTNKLGIDLGIQSFYENYMLCKLRTDLDLTGCCLQSYDLEANAVRQFAERKEEVEEVLFPGLNLDETLNPDGLFSAD